MRKCAEEAMDEAPWFVLQVLTNQEKRVAKHLALRSLEHYLPLYSERSRWSDRIVNLERPLFSGYVFTRFAPQTRRAVVSTPGVLRLLGDEERDTVPALEIRRIRESLACGNSLRPHGGPAIGSRVRVGRGPFQGVEGMVTELRKSCKVILSLAATRQCFSLEVDLTDIDILERSDTVEPVDRNRQLAFSGV
jgi:transcription antitermination factor NusG